MDKIEKVISILRNPDRSFRELLALMMATIDNQFFKQLVKDISQEAHLACC